MDLDPAGADVSGESQLDIDPSSGLDPTRQVKYVPTAATSIYPNVTQPLLTPVTSATDQQVTPPAPKALAGIPVIGQNVPSAPVDLSPPNAVNLAMSATGRSGNPLVMQAGTGATQITQTNQPPAAPTVPMPRPRPEAAGPGASQLVPRGTGTGPMGTDETMVAPYNPQRGSLETAKANLQAMAERQEQYARNPFFQIFDAPGTRKALQESIDKRMKLDDMERKQADDAAVQLQAKNSGLTGDFHGSRDLVTQSVVQDYLSGDPIRAGRAQAMLNATGHGDLTKALEAQSVEAVLSQFKTRQSIGDELDTATTDKEYQQKREQLQKKDPDYKIPDTMAEWNTPAQRGARKAAEQSAMLMINRHLSTLAQQGDYTREANGEQERSYASVAKNYDNTPITENEGVSHLGLSTHGSRGPEGSKDVRGLGTTWNWATPENIAKADAMGKTQYPEAERTKDEHVLRAIRQIITDPKTGELMTGEELKHHLNTNPNLLAAIKEAFAAEYREGGGATAQLVRMALNERGKVQGWFDEIMANWAGGKAVITGDAIQKYMTDASQEQIRYVLDMVTRDTLKDAAGRLNNMADFAGMKGFTKEQLPVSPELQDILEERMLKARERNIEALSNQARVVSGNSSVWFGPDNNATRAIPGSFVKPVPRSSLPHLYPELQNPAPPPNPPQPGTIREVPITKPPEKRSEAEEPGVLSKVVSALNPISAAHAEEAPKTPEGPALLGVTSPHMVQAHKDLNMTPQEQSLYERHLVNLNSAGGVDNADGSRSTLYQATVKRGDRYYNVPQVFDGKILPPKEADARIDKIGWDKFPSYATDKEANDRYMAMHGYMEKDTRDYMAKRRAVQVAQRANNPPTVPTPQAPGGEGTEHPPPAAPAPQGSRGGGSFSNGVPSGGFPAAINNNQVARTVYGTAGQTAKNVLGNRPNADVVANNVAIVAASSAKSESNFKPDTLHDPDEKTGVPRGYGLFGHNGDRLRGMAASAGVDPFQSIPPNAQAAWYAREMSLEAERDPFIGRVLNDPNASAEDLTRVQMRMEQPKGYKPGQEEKGKNWAERLANTQALMAGRPVATAGAVPAVPATTAAAQPSRFSPAGVRESLASRNPYAAGAYKEGLWMAPGMVGNAVGGAVAGPPGAAVVGGLVQGGTNIIRHRMEAPPEQQSLSTDALKGGVGFAQGATMAIPGFRPAAIASRVALGGAIPGFEAYMEGKSAGDIYNATTLGMAGSAVGETFGASLGAAQYGIWKILDLKGRSELMSIGKTLATEPRKVADPATGKMVDNDVYVKALDRAKQLRQEPDDLAHGWNVINGKTMQEADKGAPLTRTEALATRPGETARYEAQRKLDDIQQEANEAAKPPGASFRVTAVHDPRSLIGNEVPNKQMYKTDAQTAFDRMNRKANSWGEVWDNIFQARSDLLTKSRESARIQGPGAKEASEAYQAMADKVFEQQKAVANKLLPPDRAQKLIDRLESARNDYREAVLAGGHDIIKTIAGGGPNAERAAAAVNKLNANDPQARAVTAALLRLHNHGGLKGSLQGVGGIGTAIYAAMHAPGVGHLVGGVAMGYGLYKSYRTLNALWAARGAGSTAKFEQLVHRAPLRFKLPVGAGAVIGGQIGATQGPGYIGVQ